MSQLFRPRANALAFASIIVAVSALALTAVVAVALSTSPYATGTTFIAEQPVPFSHKHHVGALGIDCRYCHDSPARSRFAGVPSTDTCMTCHAELWTRADMLAPVRRSLSTGQPLAWVRVHDLADFVYFDHRAHVVNGVGCESCHGRVDRMPLTRQVAPLTMQWCLNCHRDPAPHLRPAESITAMGYERPRGRLLGRALVESYAIRTNRLTECNTCHR